MVHGCEAKAVIDIKGYVVDLSEMKDVRGGKGNRKVIGLTLGDKEGLIMVSLWTPVAEQCVAQLEAAFDSTPDGQFAHVKFTSLEVVNMCSEPKSLRKLQSRRDTTVSGKSF